MLTAAHSECVQGKHFRNCVAQSHCRPPPVFSRFLKSDTDGFVLELLMTDIFYDYIIQEFSVFATKVYNYSFRKTPKATFRPSQEVKTLHGHSN